jgi:hypothetical protein
MNTPTKGWEIMKNVAVALMICMLTVTAVPVLAQNGSRPQNRGQNGRTQCRNLDVNQAPLQLSAEEEIWLLYMREEEKLARDVYLEFYGQYLLRIFDNIAASEQRHFDALGELIDRYGLTDPAQAGPGLFTNQDLQAAYDSLIEEGMESVLSALRVGVAIEEQDIIDLKVAIGESNSRDLVRVYSNLLNGSMNHLDAFESHIEVVSGN